MASWCVSITRKTMSLLMCPILKRSGISNLREMCISNHQPKQPFIDRSCVTTQASSLEDSSLHVLDKSALYGSSQGLVVVQVVPPQAAQLALPPERASRCRVPIYRARAARSPEELRSCFRFLAG